MQAPKAISFHYKLTNQHGEELDNSIGDEPLSFIEGQSQIIPGLEKELVALSVGTKKIITVVAKDAYGERNPELELTVPRKDFPENVEVEVGDQFRMTVPEKGVSIVTVTEIQGEQVKVDGNHPLAGLDLTFDIEITSKREATKEELEDCDCGEPH